MPGSSFKFQPRVRTLVHTALFRRHHHALVGFYYTSSSWFLLQRHPGGIMTLPESPESRIRFPNLDPGLSTGLFCPDFPRKRPVDNPRIGIQESDSGFRGFREGSCLRKRAVFNILHPLGTAVILRDSDGRACRSFSAFWGLFSDPVTGAGNENARRWRSDGGGEGVAPGYGGRV